MKPEVNILIRRLEEAGYFSAYGLLGDGNFRPYDWEKMAGQLSGELGELWRFFLLGGKLSKKRLRELVGAPALDALQALGLCQDSRGAMSLGAFSLVTYRGVTFLVDRGTKPRAYFGDDTRALMTLLPRPIAGRCLCLYPQSSVAVLPLVGRSKVSLVFAKGPHSPDVIQANLLLNEAQGEHRILRTGVPKSRGEFDFMVATCPSTFALPGVKMPRTISGGPDGRQVLRELLTLAAQSLAEGGSLFTTFLFFGKSNANALREELAGELDPYGLGYSLLVCSKHLMQPGVPVFNMLFGLATAGKPSASEATARALLEHVRKMKFEAAYLVKARFLREARPVRREIFDFSDVYYGSWTF